MVLVIVAALLTTALYIFFKVFGLRRIPLLPAIVVNYVVAFLFGLLCSHPWTVPDTSVLWLPAALQGAMFILLFQLMGIASQRVGIAATTVATKMSLALTVLLTVLIFHERPAPIAWVGIALAITGVACTSWGGRLRGGAAWWLLPVLFIASSMSDVLIGIAQRIFISPMTEAVFPTLVFGCSAFLGLGWLAFRPDRRSLLDPRTWFYGGLLGCVNYGSVYFLVRALSDSGMQVSSVFPVVNVGVILFGSAASIILFKERLKPLHWAGIAMSIAALCCILAARS